MTGVLKTTEEFASREYFYIGGDYVDDGNDGFVKESQMYVEKLTPTSAGERGGAQKFPVVFIHGNGQSGTVSRFPVQMVYILIIQVFAGRQTPQDPYIEKLHALIFILHRISLINQIIRVRV